MYGCMCIYNYIYITCVHLYTEKENETEIYLYTCLTYSMNKHKTTEPRTSTLHPRHQLSETKNCKAQFERKTCCDRKVCTSATVGTSF